MELKTTRYAIEAQVATITLSRPKRMNAWTGRMHTEYRHLLARAEADPEVRVIVITGDPAGGAFCPGADTAAVSGHAERGAYDAGTPEDIAKPGFGVRPEFDANFAYHFGLTKPVIAAINGAIAGVGLVLACYADLRFAVPGAKFTAAHGKLNYPAELGLSWVLPRLTGITHAADILLSCRVFLAGEALQMGLLNKVLPPDDLMPYVRDYAAILVEKNSPGALRMTKNQLYTDQHRPVNEAVKEAERLLDASVNHPDSREGILAWLEKRPARWQGG
ncbi:MAG: enoyl-CoA hydratase [Alphaproteobacteria bacterium]|nr:enoyl-CoA hydratase [Alphaproteobacteria bacterium]